VLVVSAVLCLSARNILVRFSSFDLEAAIVAKLMSRYALLGSEWLIIFMVCSFTKIRSVEPSCA
jgi:hypothetical protein